MQPQLLTPVICLYKIDPAFWFRWIISLDRVARVGYEKVFLGETISETYESEITTLTAWINSESTREVILDPRANELGSLDQEPNGKSGGL